MSKGSRWAIGTVALLGAVAFWLSAIVSLAEGLQPWSAILFDCLMATFATAIGLACFLPRSHAITLRIIGALVFVALASLLVNDIQKANEGQEQLHWRRVILVAVFGLPALYVALFGAYPLWGRFSGVFRQPDDDEDRPNE